MIWGKEFVEKVKAVNSLIGELFIAVQDLIDAKNPSKGTYVRTPDIQTDILYAIESNDEYYERLEKVINEIEEELKPYIDEYHKKY